jgi:hypothetical protein
VDARPGGEVKESSTEVQCVVPYSFLQDLAKATADDIPVDAIAEMALHLDHVMKHSDGY